MRSSPATTDLSDSSGIALRRAGARAGGGRQRRAGGSAGDSARQRPRRAVEPSGDMGWVLDSGWSDYCNYYLFRGHRGGAPRGGGGARRSARARGRAEARAGSHWKRRHPSEKTRGSLFLRIFLCHLSPRPTRTRAREPPRRAAVDATCAARGALSWYCSSPPASKTALIISCVVTGLVAHCVQRIKEARVRKEAQGAGPVLLDADLDEAVPARGTRRVRLVRGEGRGVSD